MNICARPTCKKEVKNKRRKYCSNHCARLENAADWRAREKARAKAMHYYDKFIYGKKHER